MYFPRELQTTSDEFWDNHTYTAKISWTNSSKNCLETSKLQQLRNNIRLVFALTIVMMLAICFRNVKRQAPSSEFSICSTNDVSKVFDTTSSRTKYVVCI